MPTATTTLGWSWANWGPVPETYTISPSCTASTDLWIAYTDLPWAPFWPEVCSTTAAEPCWPMPTDESLYEDYANNRYQAAYWSPGVDCPSGWTSIGQAAHPTNGPVTSSGVFKGYPGRADYNGSVNENEPMIYGYRDALGALLDAGETAIACCPTFMTVGNNGLCYETLASHPVSTACNGEFAAPESTVVTTTFMLDGTTYTGPVRLPVTDSFAETLITASITSFPVSETGRLVAMSMAGPIYLVHQEVEASPGKGKGGGDSEQPEETGGETNAAVARFYAGQSESGWKRIWGMLGVLGVSVLAGFVLVLPV